METNTGGTRDRAATTGRILDALEAILIREGFSGLGVNSIAREAGVDKVLIYRYFGGMPELIREFVLTRDVWPEYQEFLPPGMAPEKFETRRLSERFTAVLIQGEKVLRKRPLTLALLTWEMSDPDRLLADFTRQREQQLNELMKHACEGGAATVDNEAVFVALWAGMIHLTLLGRSRNPMGGMRPHKKADRKRIDATIEKITQKVLKDKKKKKPGRPRA